ncbi:hypothetical protein MUK42_20702 [Musa troglodytarum]|uniref:Uncharacterized protein n=1 Tax=Musa troglodytarum TaxID=320322 RepID=A0A9E7K5R6_9LILI|nr:hypothetical protein MUK42_20702 [Musa troglodytarum]
MFDRFFARHLASRKFKILTIPNIFSRQKLYITMVLPQNMAFINV